TRDARSASISSGAFTLAVAGILDGSAPPPLCSEGDFVRAEHPPNVAAYAEVHRPDRRGNPRHVHGGKFTKAPRWLVFDRAGHSATAAQAASTPADGQCRLSAYSE
ncbi:MAG: hypothetical protein WCB80_31075, partial [Mycobacterium sp.]